MLQFFLGQPVSKLNAANLMEAIRRTTAENVFATAKQRIVYINQNVSIGLKGKFKDNRCFCNGAKYLSLMQFVKMIVIRESRPVV